MVPPVLALLPEYAGREDPVAALRAAAGSAVAWLAEDGAVRVVSSDAQVERVAEHLLATAAPAALRDGGSPGLLVMANGSAKRSEKAPGHLDPRAAGFDQELGAALATGDTAALGRLDEALAADLWATGAAGLRALAGLIVTEAVVDHAEDTYGVAYWVVRWTCAS